VTRLLTESSVRLAEIKSDCPRRRVIMVSGPDTERRPKYTIKASLKDPRHGVVHEGVVLNGRFQKVFLYGLANVGYYNFRRCRQLPRAQPALRFQ
jgi:hypothetical protein